MTPKAQRIAIAEACGWKRVKTPFKVGYEIVDYPIWQMGDDVNSRRSFRCIPLPDYLGDLNMIHGAVAIACEKTGFPFQEAYTRELRAVVTRRRRGLNEMQFDYWMAEATAAQCSEAFLRTLGLWQDSKGEVKS